MSMILDYTKLRYLLKNIFKKHLIEDIDSIIREIQSESKPSESATPSPRLTRSRAKAANSSLSQSDQKGTKRNIIFSLIKVTYMKN